MAGEKLPLGPGEACAHGAHQEVPGLRRHSFAVAFPTSLGGCAWEQAGPGSIRILQVYVKALEINTYK